jgi:hypothetical protein
MTETRYGTAHIVANELELERFVDESDTILPFYRIPLTGEYLAAWAVRALREKGCRCKRLAVVTTASKRATRADKELVYYIVAPMDATLVRGGLEIALSLKFTTREEESNFISFITDLMCDGVSSRKPV